VGMGLLFALWSWWRSRSVVEPLLELTAAANGITEGKPIALPLFNRQDELAILARAFQQTIASLQAGKEELELLNIKLSEQAALLDIATDGILVRSLDDKILFWNRGAETIYGWSAAEAINQDANRLLNPTNSEQLADAWRDILSIGEWRGELTKNNKSGHTFIVESRWTLVRDRDNKPQFVLTVDTDISEKKQLEAQFLRAQRLESLGTLAGGIAHDMNNILTPISAAAQLLSLKLRTVDDTTHRLLEIVGSSSQRGADLVKQILSFAKGIEGEKNILQSQHILKEIGQIAKSTFPKSIEIEFDIPTQTLWAIHADGTQLHQVMMNLCVNARDAMPMGGKLTISAENFNVDSHNIKLYPEAAIGSYVLIKVIDTGEGMSAATMDRIFEPFYTTKDIGKGTGLGLSTVAGIIKNHHGFIRVYSEIDRGTCFAIYLPATLEAEIDRDSGVVVDGHGESVLIIDDEQLILEVAQTSLATHNYQVITANNGRMAIDLYQEQSNPPVVVLVDLMMPELDGIATISQLKQINPHLKVIANSGLIQPESIPINVDAFLTKPYSLIKLLATIRSVIGN
jgi:two-component system, cell cycle sensor histidine kinase and response regulator CckA